MVHTLTLLSIYQLFFAKLSAARQLGITATGTKWCGPGNTASSYDDLGTEVAADKCCRAHDHCNETIQVHNSNYGLINDDWFPIFRCHCEQEFRACLQDVNNMAANTIGRVYFHVRDKCFDFNHPISECEQWQWDTFRKRCIQYKLDDVKPKQWLFYELPFYTIRTDVDDVNEASGESN